MTPPPTPKRARLTRIVAASLALALLGLTVERIGAFSLLRLAIQRSPAGLPSSLVVPETDVARGLAVLSIVADEADLYDPAMGILTHATERGASWERNAAVSYFEGGTLRFASNVGLRIHGGSSRTSSPIQSYRLYFRRKYGAAEIAPGSILGFGAPSLRRLVVHNDLRRRAGRYWRLVNPLAYDIARRIGCVTVEAKPVSLYLNGERQGVYVISEFLDDNYFRTHYGHEDFFATEREQNALWRRLSTTRQLTMAVVERDIDLENMTRWFLSVLVTDTHDAFQAPNQFRDQRTPGARWFWINWDMDQSFLEWDHDTFQTVLERIGEPRRGRSYYEPRAYLFTRLLTEDEEYRAFFARLFDEVLNHRVTAAFLDERFSHYRQIAIDHGIRDRRFLDILQGFVERRPAFLRRLAEVYLNTDSSRRVIVRNPARRPLLIDGFPVSTDYEGQYLPGNELMLRVAEQARADFRGWVVDGEHRPSTELDYSTRVRSDITVEAIFR